jgi:hypothetical protein
MLGPKALGTHITRQFFGINGALPWSNKAKLRSASHISPRRISLKRSAKENRPEGRLSFKPIAREID